MNQDQKKLAQFGLGAIVVIMLGLLLWKFEFLETKLSSAPLKISPETYDFGDVSMAKGKVSTKFTLKNEGTESLKITDVRTSCMCTVATIDGIEFGMHQPPPASFVIRPEETKEMLVIFDPNAHGPDATGAVTRIITLKTDSRMTPITYARVNGNVIK